jgi:hypothetical protein
MDNEAVFVSVKCLFVLFPRFVSSNTRARMEQQPTLERLPLLSLRRHCGSAELTSLMNSID